MEFGFITDEIDIDVAKAMETGIGWGVSRFEIRTVFSGRVPGISHDDLHTLRVAARSGRAVVTALSPGLFKRYTSDMAAIEHELAHVLPRSIAMARELGTRMIHVFSFKRSGDQAPGDSGEAVALMRRAAVAAEREGMLLAIENEPGYFCDSGTNTAAFIHAVASPAVRANWDPANAVGSGERPFPEGYDALKQYIVNVHAKDTAEGSLIRCVPIGEGLVDWEGQIAALIADSMVGHVTIETHVEPLVEMSLRNLTTLRAISERTYSGDRSQ